MRKSLKRQPRRYEEIAGVGPKRAEKLRRELGPYSEFKNNSKNFKRNKIASVVSGNRRNLPKFAENVVIAGSSKPGATDAVDKSLISQTDDGRTVKSKTLTKRRNKDADRSGLGFETQETDDVTFGAAFDAFRDEYDDPFDVPARNLADSATDVIDDSEVTAQPIIGGATSRVTFAKGAQPEDLKNEFQSTAENIDRPTASPGELADGFVNFVTDEFGFGKDVGEFEVDRRDMKRAEKVQSDRSIEARRVDNSRRAPVTTDFDRWEDNPSGLDFPGVDTPLETPQKKDTDLMF